MILAAGLGTRMRPITKQTPKSLVQVDGHSLIDHIIDRLVEGGVTDIVVNLHYLGDQVERQLSRRESPNITFSWEHGELLETGGGVKNALKQLGNDPFWVVPAKEGKGTSETTGPLPCRRGETKLVIVLASRVGNHLFA